MADEGMLRGTRNEMRDERGASGTRRGPTKGRLVDFYDDLGFSATKEQHDTVMADEAKFNKEVSDYQGKIDKAQGQYNSSYSSYQQAQKELVAAQKKIPTLNNAIESSWRSYKSNLVGVRVMGPSDKIEATYYVPKDAASSLVGQRGVFASYHNGGRNLNVMIKNYRNQSLHDTLRNAGSNLESKYKAKARQEIAPEIAQANKTISQRTSDLNTYSGQLSNYKSDIDRSRGSLSATKSSRASQWAELRQKYSDRINNMKEMLGGMTIEE